MIVKTIRIKLFLTIAHKMNCPKDTLSFGWNNLYGLPEFMSPPIHGVPGGNAGLRVYPHVLHRSVASTSLIMKEIQHRFWL
ncbi:TPA: hypothetical protein SMF29_002737 [Serratia marcescens]|nr:hypothetical protein [Serratia marcescens]